VGSVERKTKRICVVDLQNIVIVKMSGWMVEMSNKAGCEGMDDV